MNKYGGLFYMKKYENFKNCLKNLKDIYDYEEPYGNVELLNAPNRTIMHCLKN